MVTLAEKLLVILGAFFFEIQANLNSSKCFFILRKSGFLLEIVTLKKSVEKDDKMRLCKNTFESYSMNK